MKLVLFALILAMARELWAQSTPTLSVNVNIVSLLATVHDHSGKIVNDLTPEGFVLKRTDTNIYAIRFSDPLPFRGPVRTVVLAAASERGKHGLEQMARETGGAHYEVRKDRTIEDIYAQIEESLRNQYSIGYTPERAAPDGKYHIIKLTTITPNQMGVPPALPGWQ
jgi:hypothetical protein